jgi:hypothetical protein
MKGTQWMIEKQHRATSKRRFHAKQSFQRRAVRVRRTRFARAISA